MQALIIENSIDPLKVLWLNLLFVLSFVNN